MNRTKHLCRSNESVRGICIKMIELALEYGNNKKDKIIIDRKNIY